ncbi:hypothetical protein FOZ60_013891 [Perkinsus olseni]|uniref:Uncharacterized protein n=1 Tax=Perkinsus olseni TaxID=32597 RepID=A0A7J6N8J1_PEROL|nr:hypothetical protein FOZ60_013891 [Perkinsus olseni]
MLLCTSECNRLDNNACQDHPDVRVGCRCDRDICRNMYYTSPTAVCVHGIDEGCDTGIMPVPCPPAPWLYRREPEGSPSPEIAAVAEGKSRPFKGKDNDDHGQQDLIGSLMDLGRCGLSSGV